MHATVQHGKLGVSSHVLRRTGAKSRSDRPHCLVLIEFFYCLIFLWLFLGLIKRFVSSQL